MAIAVHASTPAPKTVSSASQVSNQFSPPAGSTIVVTYGTPINNLITGVSDSLVGHLGWKKLNSLSENSDCNSEIWLADCPSAQTNMTVTATVNPSGSGVIAVIVLTGVAPSASQPGSTGQAGNLSGAYSVAVTTKRDGSFVIGSIATRNSGTAPTFTNSGTDVFNSITFYTLSTGTAHYMWSQWVGAPTATAGTTVTISNSVSFEYDCVVAEIYAQPAPAIDAVIPDGGDTAGGNSIIITGQGFTGASAVHFDAVDATSYNVVNDSVITAVVPAGSLGSVNITITTPIGTSSGFPYLYYTLADVAGGPGVPYFAQFPPAVSAANAGAAPAAELPQLLAHRGPRPRSRPPTLGRYG